MVGGAQSEEDSVAVVVLVESSKGMFSTARLRACFHASHSSMGLGPEAEYLGRLGAQVVEGVFFEEPGEFPFCFVDAVNSLVAVFVSRTGVVVFSRCGLKYESIPGGSALSASSI